MTDKPKSSANEGPAAYRPPTALGGSVDQSALIVRMRPMAADPVLWLSSLIIIGGLAVQGAFIFWMW